jgi:signal transduction histidine kinase
VEANGESRSLATVLRLGIAGIVVAAFFVDGWVFGTFRGYGWAAPGVLDRGDGLAMMACIGGVMMCGLAWALWPQSTPGAAVVASLISLAITLNLSDRLRFPFFTEAVVLIVMLGAVLWERQVWSWPVAVLVVVTGASISTRAGSGGVRNVLAATMLVLFASVVTVVVYAWMKDNERRVSIELARRNGRLELARELHDVVGHHVTGIVVIAQANRFAAAAAGGGGGDGGSDADRALADIERAGLETLTSVRRLVGLLRDDAPTTAGPQLADIEQLVADLRSTHPHAVLEADLAIRAGWVPADLATTVHRLTQEAITNVRKYGDPDGRVTAAVRRTPRSIVVEVQNRPLAGAAGASTGLGYGLVGMRERVEALGGAFAAGAAGDVWIVQATLPLATLS